MVIVYVFALESCKMQEKYKHKNIQMLINENFNLFLHLYWFEGVKEKSL